MDKITVKYGLLKKLIKAIEKTNPTDETDLSFEFIVGSLFPDIMNKIKQEIRFQYTMGYAAGLKEKR